MEYVLFIYLRESAIGDDTVNVLDQAGTLDEIGLKGID
jgi:hypothetical protein